MLLMFVRRRTYWKSVDFIEASLGVHLGLQRLRLGIASSGLSMTRGEGAPARAWRQQGGSTGGQPAEQDATEDRTNAEPDLWRERAEQARARAGRLRDRNIRTALFSIAEGLERLGLRAHDARRPEAAATAAPQFDTVSENGTTDCLDATPAAALHVKEILGPKAHPPAMPEPGTSATAVGGWAQPKLPDVDRADTSLVDTFRIMEALALKPQPTSAAIPDRIERVARALCQADGRDPDRVIETRQCETVLAGGMQTRRPVTLRGWKVYEKNARQFLAALDAALAPPI